ncbi:hypothetical protein ACFSQQ_16550 [Mesorhizobium kowhaii]|uniref:hypothetical protein n=1 Tax=Mesorhizobium kowhaii TaxID=1300272 RepID=UPI0035E985F3
MIFFDDIKLASKVFGPAALVYGPMLNEIGEKLFLERYSFEDIGAYMEKSMDPDTGRQYSGQVYWKEILYRSHMSAIASLVRAARWVDSAVRENEAGNLFGWAGACRSLIESAGDTGHSLGAVPLTLAQNHRQIRTEISGEATGPMLARLMHDDPSERLADVA